MSEPRRHHFVSQMQLRRFAGENRKLFSFDKSHPEKRVFESSPKSIFFERDLYSLLAKDGTRNAALEMQFSKLESRARAIIGKIIEAAQAGRLAALSPEEKVVWDQFFYF